jgi:uncharacterized protein
VILGPESKYAVEPFFFGGTSGTLFGCHHRPPPGIAREHGIVLCAPIGREYIQSHRTFYQLAVRLARAGFHVLRFDYFGCGDSAGDFENGSLRQWTLDIQTAADALERRSDQKHVFLLGMRLGANLAMMAAADNALLNYLVLWEPILDGRRYVSELTSIQKAFSKQFKGKKEHKDDPPQEVLGFRLTDRLRNDLEAIHTDLLCLGPEVRLLTVTNQPHDKDDDALARLIGNHPNSEHRMIADHQAWYEELYKRLIPVETMNFVVNWIDKAHS